MRLLDIVQREPHPVPWSEGEKIPWHEPSFSRRMLQEHLSQAHDAASRRADLIDRHVDWIHHDLLAAKPTQILDLGCGPGLYTSRLAQMGHTCVGIDYGPAAIAYARAQAEVSALPCTYVEADLRQADYGRGYGLVMLLFGEFNVFRPADAARILAKAHTALAPGGVILLEPHTDAAVRALADASSWYAAGSGLFSEQPHLCLQESIWDDEQRVTIERYYIVDAETGTVERHAASIQAYTDAEYRTLLADAGFGAVASAPGLTGEALPSQTDLMVWVGRKAAED